MKMGPTPLPTPSTARRSNLLTAGAFDFSFATPSPKSGGNVNKGKGKTRDIRPIGISSGLDGGLFSTPDRQGSVKKEKDGTPLRDIGEGRTGRKGSGLIVDVKEEEDIKPKIKTPKRLTALSSVSTPWMIPESPRVDGQSDSSSSSSKRRKLGDLEVHLPAPKVKDEKEDLGRRVALRSMNEGVKWEAIPIDVEEKEDVVEKEVGIGISPRKGRIKWTGKGEPPLTVRLNALLTTQSSSLTLFYTSLQHTLHPSRSAPRRPNPHLSANTDTKPDIQAPSPLDHVRTAPIRLLLLRPVSSRSHVAQLWLANVRTWPRPAARLHIHEPEEECDPPQEVIVSFAAAAKGAAGAGGDVRVITGRWWERHERGEVVEAGRWEVGVWSEWSMLDMPGEESAGDEEQDDGGKEIIKGRKVLFVSRYLIAERK